MPITIISSTQPDGGELAAKLVSLFSSTILSVLYGVKTYNVQFKYLTYSRWLILLLYIFSWAFAVMSMILVTTNNGNYTSCLLTVMVCDILYCATKIVIYAWLIEKIYVVSATRQSRWSNKSYRFNLGLLLPYIAIFILMIVYHRAYIEPNGYCIIGIAPAGTIPLIAINLYMTVFFVRPLLKLGGLGIFSSTANSRLHEVALRTLVASVVCLVVSFANILSLIILDGRERGLLCMTCCTLDVTINVITVHWVTSQAPGKRSKETDVQGTHLSETHEQTMYRKEEQDVIGFNNVNLNMSYEKTPVEDDHSSTEAGGFAPSFQESQTSRKTLTKL
ncbi:hypothetical protein CU097_007928 [Rhizopus azygosporus]|uniref:G-protein coupled receptors family 2 profile 2 domain-containing protein n=1 Tax=Rhizopus azygosporus TaxID=86630 RepID=A0A367JDR6_RHIAZ|nr:hypothetical protein CU097_007928 [Rhizopus azygosporus]